MAVDDVGARGREHSRNGVADEHPAGAEVEVARLEAGIAAARARRDGAERRTAARAEEARAALRALLVTAECQLEALEREHREALARLRADARATGEAEEGVLRGDSTAGSSTATEGSVPDVH